MASPFWTYPGIWEGRLDPSGSDAIGYSYGYGYSPLYSYGYVAPSYGYFYTYSGAYGYFSENVFCLGKDRVANAPYRRIRVGDKVAVEQSFTIPASDPIRLLLFSWHMLVPTTLPESRDVVQGGEVSFVSGDIAGGGRGVTSVDSGESGVIIHDAGTGTGSFMRADAELPLTVSGSSIGANNAIHRISAVPEDQGDASGGDRAVVENASSPTAEMAQVLNDPGITLRVHGIVWTGRVLVDWGSGYQQRSDLTEWRGHDYIRAGLAVHVSQYTGPISVKFELTASRAP